jgi:hypothetical protein
MTVSEFIGYLGAHEATTELAAALCIVLRTKAAHRVAALRLVKLSPVVSDASPSSSGFH